jgi:hypothetical protein
VTDALRAQLASEIAHWRHAAGALSDLDLIASPAAWAGLEQYLSTQVRRRLESIATSIQLEAAQVATSLEHGTDLAEVRRQVLRLRARYLQAETVHDFYLDAITTRSVPELSAVLRGLDRIASDSLDTTLRPLGLEAPPVLVYLDRGLGASILRANIRLFDEANPSPAAAIKITRHNLYYPTALLHECGHQFAHLTGWTAELADALASALGRESRELGEMWQSTASEVAADVYGFCLSGWAPIPALANVVDGTTATVYRRIPGDPHPYPLLRVLFNSALARAWYGAGAGNPWDAVAHTWALRHRPDKVPGEIGELTRRSLAAMHTIVDICTRQPMDAFKGRPLSSIADPKRMHPARIADLVLRAGPSLLTSPYLARRESLSILAWLSTRSVVDPMNAKEHRERLRKWLAWYGAETVPAAA